MALLDKIPRKYLPSRKFTFRALGILVGLLIIYLVFLYAKTYSAIKNAEIKTVTSTAENIIEKDTDGDGLRDWEEALWGTNPAMPATFGEPDKNYVEKKRKQMAENSGTQNGQEDLDATETLAKEFLSTLIALKQSGNLNQFNITNLAQKFSTNIGKDVDLPNHYTISDIKTGKDDKASRNAYYAKVKSATLVAKKGGMGSELKVIADFFSSEKLTKDGMLSLAKTYSTFTKSLAGLEVPPSATEKHLAVINESYNMSLILNNILEVENSSIVGLIAIAQFEKHEPKLTQSITDLTNYFKASGIIK
ncbi:MAG: hypothetical protein RL641_93 [Candidatus Parcubacteria bacterium]|jgi:hypothetical protein